MSDRLKELQGQRALAQEQLEWFDREIVRESGGKSLPVAEGAPPPPVAGGSPEIDKQAEKILDRFRHTDHPVKDEVKRGCFLYFFAAFGLLILSLLAFWFLRRS